MSARDAGAAPHRAITVRGCVVCRKAGSAAVGFPVHVTKDAANGHHFREQGRIDFVTDTTLEGGKGIGIHVLEAFTLDLTEVDPPQPMALGTQIVEQVHVEAVGGVGLAVQAPMKLRPGSSLGRPRSPRSRP